MIEFDAEVTINRPVDEVFAVIADLQKAPDWEIGVLNVNVTAAGPVEVGTTFTKTLKMGPSKVDGKCHNTRFEDGQVLAFALDSGPLDCVGEFTVEAVSEGTRLRSTGSGRLHGPFRLMTPMMGARVKRDGQREVENLKALLEKTRV